MNNSSPSLSVALRRGLRTLCPRCGKGKLYTRWMVLVDQCPECSCEIKGREGDCWAFLFASTAFITGIFLLIILFTDVSQLLLGQILVGVGAGSSLLLTLPVRKGIAIAIDYVLEQRHNHF